uniref:helix-turn-helix domain-containing protein n=1 Tax=Candidatus Ventrenecus sp. TaxID=3085654 RepID=UPI003FF05F4B
MCMIDVGEKIRYIRETYDVKGNELADILNISKSSISHYEKNDRDVPLRNLVK